MGSYVRKPGSFRWFFQRRWQLEKYNRRNGKPIEITPPEPRRLYWTLGGALTDEIRLNGGLMSAHSPNRYRIVKLGEIR